MGGRNLESCLSSHVTRNTKRWWKVLASLLAFGNVSGSSDSSAIDRMIVAMWMAVYGLSHGKISRSLTCSANISQKGYVLFAESFKVRSIRKWVVMDLTGKHRRSCMYMAKSSNN
jgi:hypothetical protein